MSVFINGKSVVTRGSGGKSIAPDVCYVSTPAGPVPTPFVSTASSADLADGSASVLVEGEPVCLKSSTISATRGTEPGTGGGVVSAATGAKAEFVSAAFGVLIEGAQVVCHGDLVLHNDKNTPPTPVIQAPGVAVAAGTAFAPAPPAPSPPCPFCEQQHPPAAPLPGGNWLGSSSKLRQTIARAKPELGRDLQDHGWELKALTGSSSLAAHHVICSEAVDNAYWKAICKAFGYDINTCKNGVMLPRRLDLACALKVQLHRGNHSGGLVHDSHRNVRQDDEEKDLRYPDACKMELAEIAKSIARGDACANPAEVAARLNDVSHEILQHIADFSWHLTRIAWDFEDVANAPGCAGRKRIMAAQGKCSRIHTFDKKMNPRPLQIGS